MAKEVVSGIAKNILDPLFIAESVRICWHAGEPLTLPISFYDEAIDTLEEQMSSPVRLQHDFQTNATLITKQWAEFFSQRRAVIGVSIDGPAAIHDSARRTRSRQGTHSLAMHGIDLLRSVGIDPSVICVLRESSLDQVEDIFSFFETHKFQDILFNVEETIGENSAAISDRMSTKFFDFLKKYVELTKKHESLQRIRNLDLIGVRLFSSEASHLLNGLVQPFTHISVDVFGNYWTYSPELGLGPDGKAFHIGNCRTDSIAAALASQKLWDLHKRITVGVALCKESCQYFGVCGGGSPGHKYAAARRFEVTETAFCSTNIKAVTDLLTEIALERGREEPLGATNGT
jgi:uncharacterized protein